ncbi:putative membrane protein DUF2207 [Microbacterium sp. SLBN-154]|uniref:DUF2207 domain-containing protein n=1 Tax=Microbacterium sp. SLBN-154 TaxID=2768458 RepID=UPI00114D9E94|nr:DUF2207 domain-containing protein [Microbacterium sp. SLBN-154]TQK20716.1 putative membrane protein DUF2207 [Microbacterium sp. SLBN-154]
MTRGIRSRKTWRVRAALAVTAAIGLAGVTAGGPATAAISTDGEGVVVESLQAEYGITRAQNGVSALTVAETFVVRFPASGEGRGMRRDIAESSDGAARVLRLISVTDTDGAERPSEVDSSDGVSSMASIAPEGLRGTQTFVFTYTVDGVVTVGDGTRAQEVTWAIDGREGSPALGEVRATFRVPEGLVPSLEGEPRCLTGPQGSSRTCDLTVNPGQLGAVLIDVSAEDLAADETLTLVVGFAPGTFTAVGEDSGGWIGGALALTGAAALGVGAAGIVAVRRRRRDPRSRRPLAAKEPGSFGHEQRHS